MKLSNKKMHIAMKLETMSAVEVSKIIPPTTTSEERTVEEFILRLKGRLSNLSANTDTKLSVKSVQDAYKDYLKAYQALEKMVGDFNAESGRQDRSVNRKGKKVTIKGDGLEATLGKNEQGSSIVKIEGELTEDEKGRLDELEMGPFITGFAPDDLYKYYDPSPKLEKWMWLLSMKRSDVKSKPIFRMQTLPPTLARNI